MTIMRYVVPGLSSLMGAWVLASFAGVMFNPGNAGIWTTSLVWSLLASLLVMPTLVIVHHAINRAEQRRARERRARPSPPASPRENPFVEDASRERAPDWPPSEEEGPMAPA